MVSSKIRVECLRFLKEPKGLDPNTLNLELTTYNCPRGIGNGGMKIKQKLQDILVQAIKEITDISLNSKDVAINIPKKKEHGNFSSNIAMKLSGRANMNPKELGENIKKYLMARTDFIKDIRLMGPGFLNFYLKEESFIKENIMGVENGDFKNFKLKTKNKIVKVAIVLNNLEDIFRLESLRAFINMYYLGNIYSFAGFKVRKLVVVKNYDEDLNIKYFISNFKDIEIILNEEELKDSITLCSTLDQGIFKGLDDKRFILEGVNIYKNGLKLKDITLSGLLQRIELDRIKYTLCSKAITSEMDIELTKDKLRYIQYPYSRIMSLINIFKAQGMDIDEVKGFNEELLTNPLELEMINKISSFKDTILSTISQNQPYKLIKYTNELCDIFYKINSSTLYRKLSKERLVALLRLFNVFKIVLKEILDILELPAYEKM